MTPWLEDADVRLYHGDVIVVLPELPAESVDCVVTSPPYWGLRDYGTGAWSGGEADCDHMDSAFNAIPQNREGRETPGGRGGTFPTTERQFKGTCGKCGATRIDQQLGLEPTPEQYVERMVEVFREVRRVLAAHGTVWLNLGDSYATNPGNGRGGGEKVEGGVPHYSAANKLGSGLKPKDLVGIPWRVAFALQADGWYLRSDIIWSKPNPMPESVTDRPTKAHEYVFLLSKQPRYFFDQEAVREAFDARPQQRLTANIDMPLGPARVAAGVQQGNPQGGTHVSRFAVQKETLGGVCGCHDAGCGRSFHADDCGCACHEGEQRGPDGRRKTHVEAANGSIQHRDGERWPNGGRNIRSVWEIATQPYPEAHFATFPEELARRCIAAGCPEQVCRVCGKARERVVDVTYEKSPVHGAGSVVGRHYETGANNFDGAGMPRLNKVTETTGFTDCGHADYRPGIVLDPFIGSGTVAHVARKLGRHAVGIDLNAEYLALAARRLQQQSLFADVT